MSFTVAIVGRPNVGKSTLFNRLAGKRLALVDDQPGLTRDRREAEATLGSSCAVTLIDTAGLEPGDKGLTPRMRQQTEAAIAQADLVVFLIDARAGVVSADEIFADLVRGSGKPVILAANKCEGRAAEPGVYEAYSLGLGEPLPISAEHGIGVGELSEAIQRLCQDRGGTAQDQGDIEELGPHPLRIAIVGRPNVGKSTLVNALLGEERMITGPEAGITRDAIASELQWDGRPLLLFDTAGLRRKMRVEGHAEEISVGDALKAIRFAEVVVLLLDVEQPFEKQDLQIADLIEQEGRALVIAVNKWDLVREREKRLNELRETCQRLLPQIKGVPLVPVSALGGKGLDKLMSAVLAADAHRVDQALCEGRRVGQREPLRPVRPAPAHAGEGGVERPAHGGGVHVLAEVDHDGRGQGDVRLSLARVRGPDPRIHALRDERPRVRDGARREVVAG